MLHACSAKPGQAWSLALRELVARRQLAKTHASALTEAITCPHFANDRLSHSTLCNPPDDVACEMLSVCEAVEDLIKDLKSLDPDGEQR